MRPRGGDRGPSGHDARGGHGTRGGRSGRVRAVDPGRHVEHQRPATGGLRRAEARQPAGSPTRLPSRTRPSQGPERGERVVRHLACPDEVPQGVEHLAIRPAPGCGVDLAIERGAAPGEEYPDRVLTRTGRPLAPRPRRGTPAARTGTRDLPAGPVERQPAVVAAEAPAAGPGDLTESAELVEEPRLVAGDAGRQDVALQDRRRDRQSGQLVHHLGKTLERGLGPERRRRLGRSAAEPGQWRHPVPLDEEAGERGTVDGLHLASQAGERAAAELAEDVGVAPFALRAARSELAPQERARRDESGQGVLHHARRQPPAERRLGREERPVGPGEPGEEPLERGGRRAEERERDADRRLDPHRVTIAGGVLDRDPADLAGDPERRPPDARPRASPSHSAATPGGASLRATTSASARSPTRRRRSWSWSAVVARRSSARPWRPSSRSASAAGSSSSRSSSCPRSSRRRSRSRVSAWARRSARGASPSYM